MMLERPLKRREMSPGPYLQPIVYWVPEDQGTRNLLSLSNLNSAPSCIYSHTQLHACIIVTAICGVYYVLCKAL